MPFWDTTDIGGFGGSSTGLIGAPNVSGGGAPITPNAIDSSGQPVNTNQQSNTIGFLNILSRGVFGGPSFLTSLFAPQVTYNTDTYSNDAVSLLSKISIASVVNLIAFELGNFGGLIVSGVQSLINGLSSAPKASNSNSNSSFSTITIIVVMAVFAILGLILLPLTKSKD